MRPKPSKQGARATAAQMVSAVLDEGRSLSELLPQLDARPDRALTSALVHETLRWADRTRCVRERLLARSMKARDADIAALLLTGLTELSAFDTAGYAAVNETVTATKQLGKGWARGLVNGVLRRFQREQAELEQALQADPEYRWSHPRWLLDQLRADWPDNWQAIAAANNARAPMSLRINAAQGLREDYLAALGEAGIAADAGTISPDAVVLASPHEATTLPGFTTGQVSVQDEAAQLAAQLLTPQAGDRVLDACAAPGGKTGHLLERQADIDLLAMDRDATRLRRVGETMTRLGLSAELRVGDAADPALFEDLPLFDRILLDAPCSATGVIRRHPDIKALRRQEDIAALVEQQRRLLDTLWRQLQPGGTLLYATCSILKAENEHQIDHFLGRSTDARIVPINAAWGQAAGHGRQILPGQSGMDGFFYALLGKRK